MKSVQLFLLSNSSPSITIVNASIPALPADKVNDHLIGSEIERVHSAITTSVAPAAASIFPNLVLVSLILPPLNAYAGQFQS